MFYNVSREIFFSSYRFLMLVKAFWAYSGKTYFFEWDFNTYILSELSNDLWKMFFLKSQTDTRFTLSLSYLSLFLYLSICLFQIEFKEKHLQRLRASKNEQNIQNQTNQNKKTFETKAICIYTVEDLYNANLETWSFALYRILRYIEYFMHYKI